jgi:hypothetical protein
VLLFNIGAEEDSPEVGTTFYVRLATTSALNANTYDNGVSGVTATITGNANGILSQSNQAGKIDLVTPVLGDIILVKNEGIGNQHKQGIYEITQLGDVSNPFILTRISGYDQTAEVFPSIIFVGAGSSNANRYFTQSTVSPVIGTDSLVFVISPQPVTTLSMIPVDAVLEDQSIIGGYTYTDGTRYPSSPGRGARMTSLSNGIINPIGGVIIKSGMKIIRNDGDESPNHNGIYTVISIGSTTTPWILQRTYWDGLNLLAKNREFAVTNINSFAFGSRWALQEQTLLNSQVGTVKLNFVQQNSNGLQNINGGVYIPTFAAESELDMTSTAAKLIANNGDVELLALSNILLNCANGYINILAPNEEINISSGLAAQLASNTSASLRSDVCEVRADGINSEIYNTVGVGDEIGILTIGKDYVDIRTNNIDTGNQNYIKIDGSINKIDIWSVGDLNLTADNGQINTFGRIYANGDFILNTDNIIYGGEGDNTQNLLRNNLNLGNAINDNYDWRIGSISNIDKANISFEGSDLYITNSDSNSGGIILDATSIIILDSPRLKATSIPSYVNDAAADADGTLSSGCIYKLNTGRTLYIKP